MQQHGPPRYYGPQGSWPPPDYGPGFRGGFNRPPGPMIGGCYRPMRPQFAPPQQEFGIPISSMNQWPPPVPPSGYRPPYEYGPRHRGPRPSGFYGRSRGGNHRGGNRRGAGNPPGQKKAPDSTTTEDADYFCETCDRGFKQEDKYKEHCDQHVKCSIDGCMYTAAPKLVKLHHQWQHKTGFAKKIWKLESAEDIEKWRAERRKNYPTKENVERKKKLEQERIARGEVVENKDFSKMRGRGRGRGGRGQGRGCRGQQRTDPTTTAELAITKKTAVPPITEMEHQQPDGDPLSYLLTKNEEHKAVVKSEIPVPIKSIGGALSSLISLYESDGSDEDENVEVGISKTGADVEIETTRRDTEQTDEAADAKNADHHPKGRRKNKCRRSKRKNERNNNNNHEQEPAWKKIRKPTLLEKLLANEIRHERNVMLQCVHYIVKNNFFDKVPNSSNQTPTDNNNVDKQDSVTATTESEIHRQQRDHNDALDSVTVTTESEIHRQQRDHNDALDSVTMVTESEICNQQQDDIDNRVAIVTESKVDTREDNIDKQVAMVTEVETNCEDQSNLVTMETDSQINSELHNVNQQVAMVTEADNKIKSDQQNSQI
ncbi:FMR1-interacting protein NUFIP1-like [Tubulanus polymorphus]|uniref:FMR1-interacting protein NUFIP1-like n=1 Tax=Tubulanus polymorphus TaxID=672921 RepID=UPI003DA62AFA